LRDLPTQTGERNGTWVLDRPRPIRPPGPPAKLPVVDRVQQTAMSALTMPPPLQTFEGMDQADGCGNCIPPDPNGAVGPNHYVQMVNSSYSVYNKTGTRLLGPIHIGMVKSQSGNAVTAANFRDDVTADGSLNATDISLTKSRSGTGLP